MPFWHVIVFYSVDLQIWNQLLLNSKILFDSKLLNLLVIFACANLENVYAWGLFSVLRLALPAFINLSFLLKNRRYSCFLLQDNGHDIHFISIS